MARQITSLLRDRQLRRDIGQAALSFVRREYSWEHAVERMRVIEARVAS
jgi:glycosyltransferase involved in cell wall biosynthesis